MYWKSVMFFSFISILLWSAEALAIGQTQQVISESRNVPIPARGGKEETFVQPYDIAVLNIDKLLHESRVAKQIQTELETQRVKFQEEMKGHEESFLAWEKKLVEQQKDIKPEDFAAKRKEFDAKVAEVHQTAMRRREQLEVAFNEAMTKVQETILVLVRDAAVKHKYKLVVPRNLIIFRDDGLEITDEILQQLDEKLPSITLRISQK
ncbi:MAG: OmpH family outer membrane protein [Caedimonas sp.]|nr:OmpH family outer membrane protein [Caedimonas sp.]